MYDDALKKFLFLWTEHIQFPVVYQRHETLNPILSSTVYPPPNPMKLEIPGIVKNYTPYHLGNTNIMKIHTVSESNTVFEPDIIASILKKK